MTSIVHIAIPCPLRQLFDYLADEPVHFWTPGKRVKVNFRNKLCVGIVMSASKVNEQLDTSKLKKIEQHLDETAVLPKELFETLLWSSRYYHHPIGECLQAALPKKIRQGESAELDHENWWTLIEKFEPIKLGKKQQACITLLQDYPDGISQSGLTVQLGQVSSTLKSLEEKGLVTSFKKPKLPVSAAQFVDAPLLHDEQKEVIEKVINHLESFSPFLLKGVTGSGKTEVYIQLTDVVIKLGKQVLILIPEIGLTSQFVKRFQQRIDGTIAILHSSVSDGERKQAWLLAKDQQADVIIGTRSAVFTPLLNPGLIIIDEEHDSSYKQQDGFKYHARNIALIRAQKLGIPIVMGSATPSLESLYQVTQNRYHLLELKQRAGGATLPKVRLINTSQEKIEHGLSVHLIKKIKQHTDAGNQVILFINRRGFAPVLMCHECGWQATCSHCDARMVVHQQRNILFCHHCGFIIRLSSECPNCESKDLKSYGAGTEKIEQHLQTLFPTVPVLRVDRDSTQRVNAFETLISDIDQGEARILVGTQMLAKGHDFHDVTLVGILDTDQGLYSADYKATENLAQMITQVTGRAGRGKKAGEVFIQTEQSEHPFWHQLIQEGYDSAAEALMQQRIDMNMPPVSCWALLRAECKEKSLALQFLEEAQQILSSKTNEVMLLGPVPSIMEKKAGRYRAQILLICEQRKFLHQLLDQSLPIISKLKLVRKVRWSIDIDPVDLM